MGIGENMDKLKDLAGKHRDQVSQGLDKAGEFIDEKTGHQHSDQIDKGREEVEKRLGADDQQR
ncbi:MAG TPA: antitoxin [Pseudonocardiaceae bacterium]|nr:antitoxin [Pseudonocardiaceae bacterium]